MALEEFSREAKDAVCDWAVRCVHVPDRPTCERLLDPKDYDVRRAEDAVAAGRLVFDAAAAGRCVQATRDAHCLGVPFTDPGCDEMLVGQVPEGEACTSDFECAGGADCEDASCGAQCCLGQCGPALTGEPPEDDRAGQGESCSQHADCDVGLYCETSQVCEVVPDEEGARCLFGCARGDLFCDVDELVCKRFGGPGEACDPAGVGAPPCDPAWSYCDETCRPRPGPGDACDDVRVCIATAYCDQDGICRARGEAGAPCNSGDHCEVACDTIEGVCLPYETCAI